MTKTDVAIATHLRNPANYEEILRKTNLLIFPILQLTTYNNAMPRKDNTPQNLTFLI